MLHASGALSSLVLSSAADKGIATGSMHPLISISDPIRGAESFASAFFCIEGSENAVNDANLMVRAMGGRAFTIDTSYKPLYHAAAVMTSGHVVSLFDTAVETLNKCGLERDRAKEVLLPLLQSSIENLEDQGTADALTGPFSRADEAAIQRHLDMFDREGLSEIKRIYIEIGARSLDLARRKGAADDKIEKIRETLMLALGKGRC